MEREEKRMEGHILRILVVNSNSLRMTFNAGTRDRLDASGDIRYQGFCIS
jgi:hypothetical protein